MYPLLSLILVVSFLGAGEEQATAGVKVGPNPSAVAFFESRIRPVLVEHCHKCHAGPKRYGGLKVDALEPLLAGGHDEGPAVIPGDTVNSSLLRALRWEGDSDLNMPPLKKLPDPVIRDFEHWVSIGAPWPDGQAVNAAPSAPPPRAPLLGRIHPIIVHLPIACLLLAVGAELLVLLRGERWRPATILLVSTGAAGAALAVVSGLWLAENQPSPLLARHELLGWLTLAGALTSAGMLIVMRWVPLPRWSLLAVLLPTALLVAATGHVGGQMSWGIDWLPL